MRWSATGGLLAASAAVFSLLLLPGEPPDPSRKGPVRTIRIDTARVTDGGQLLVEGATNFPDGVALKVRILAEGKAVASYGVVAKDGHFRLSAPGQGEVLAGDFTAAVTFELPEQAEPIRQALGYQPAALAARAPLALPLHLVAQGVSRQELESLIQAVNREPRDRGALDELDRRARVLSDRLWIAKEKVAVQKLRLAIEVARRPGELERSAFDRLLLEAHLLAGL